MSQSAALAYISFDRVPAPKGAPVHIEAFTRALAAEFGGLNLVTVAPDTADWAGVRHTSLPADGRSLIDRVICFRAWLTHWLKAREFRVIHFRSIFEGIPILRERRSARLVFEVNGLPSIELKYRYPKIVDDRELMAKIVAQEQACLRAADSIVTPSGVTREYLVGRRGVAAGKVQVIPNGVDTALFYPAERHLGEGPLRVLYFGTVAAWQGVELAIRALHQIRAKQEATLTIIGMATGRQRAALQALAAKLGIAECVRLLDAMPQTDLATELRACDIVVSPLTLTDRNVVQGCCPLKILEAMSSGVPVITSDLPVTRELGCDGEHFLLVRPGSVDAIADATLGLAGDVELRRRLGQSARRHIEQHFTWQRAGAELVRCYRSMID